MSSCRAESCSSAPKLACTQASQNFSTQLTFALSARSAAAALPSMDTLDASIDSVETRMKMERTPGD